MTYASETTDKSIGISLLYALYGEKGTSPISQATSGFSSLEETFEVEDNLAKGVTRIGCTRQFPALLTHLVTEICHRRVYLCLFPVGLLLSIDLLELPSLGLGQTYWNCNQLSRAIFPTLHLYRLHSCDIRRLPGREKENEHSASEKI